MEHLETLATSRAVIFAAELGLQQAHFEGDSELVIKALAFTDGTISSSSFGHLARDIIIHVSSLWCFSFSHIVRHEKAITHVLTQRARPYFRLFVWMESVSSDVADYVLTDVPVH